MQNFYRNYHSQRFVQDVLVIRMQPPLSNAAVDALNDQFADLVKEDRIEQGGPLDAERQYMDLPRLTFTFTKHSYGRLRLMIDRINAFDANS